MATRSPGLNSFAFTIVLCTSVSNTVKKHSLHICCPVLGRRITALDLLHKEQLFAGMNNLEKKNVETGGIQGAERYYLCDFKLVIASWSSNSTFNLFPNIDLRNDRGL